MKTYEIEQAATAVILWTGEAASERHALEQLAQDAGYSSVEDMDEQASGGDTRVVREVHMTPHRPAANTIADLRAELAAHDADPMREHPEWVESRDRVAAQLAEVEADPDKWDRRYQDREQRRITHEAAHWDEPLVALFGFEG